MSSLFSFKNKNIPSALKIIFPIILLIYSTCSSSLTYAEDLILSGNDVMVIENTTYTQTGNIYISDNAKLTIKNARFIVNVTYHDQYRLEMTGNATLEIINSTLAAGIPYENIQFNVYDETNLIVQDSDLREGAATFMFCSAAQVGPLFKGTASFTNSKFSDINLAFTPNGSQKVLVSNSEVNTLTMRFRDGFQGEFSDLKPGLFTSWIYRENGHDINIQNTTFANISISPDGPSQVVIRNSDIFTLGTSAPLSSIIVRVVDSKICAIALHRLYDITATFWGLKPGMFSNWKLSDHSTGGPLPEIILENTQITDSWGVGAFGANLSINDSTLSLTAFGSLSGNNYYVTNSTIKALMLYVSTNDIITVDNSIIDFLDVYVPPISVTIKGNITFTQPQVKRWFGPSVVKRTFPVSVVGDYGDNIPTANLSLYDKTGALIWSGQTDTQGKANFDIEFNDTNHNDTWNLVIDFNGRTTSEAITLLTSTPIKIARIYTISASAGLNGVISPSGVVEVKEGESKTVIITPDRFSLDWVTTEGVLIDRGYRVADVLVDGVSVGAVLSYTFSNIKAAHSISANFVATTPSAVAVKYDDFEGSSINTALWYVNDPNNIFSQSNGYLHIETPADFTSCNLTAKQNLTGDFDIVLPYNNYQAAVSPLPSSESSLQLMLYSTSSDGQYGQLVAMVTDYAGVITYGTNGFFNSQSLQNKITNPPLVGLPTGWLRVARIGSTIRTYYRTDGEWIMMGDFQNAFTGEVTWVIYVYTGNNGTFNISSDGVYFIKPALDKQAPVIVITAPLDNGKTNQSSVSVQGSVDEAETATIKVNSGSVQTLTMTTNNSFSFQITLTYGLNTIEVTAIDLTGNTTTVRRTIHYINTGDINGDGTLTMADAILAMQVLSGVQPPMATYWQADVNNDGKIGIAEVIYILQKSAELRPPSAVVYSNATLSGNWIAGLGTSSTISAIYLSSDGNETITDMSGINLASPPGTYQVSSNGSFSMSLKYTNNEVLTGTGALMSSTVGTITLNDSSGTIGSGTLSKVTDLALCQGNYSGTISKSGTTYNISFVVNSSGVISNFASNIPGATSASGNAYAVGNIAVMMIRTNMISPNPYGQILVSGTLGSGQFIGSFWTNGGSTTGTISLTRSASQPLNGQWSFSQIYTYDCEPLGTKVGTFTITQQDASHFTFPAALNSGTLPANGVGIISGNNVTFSVEPIGYPQDTGPVYTGTVNTSFTNMSGTFCNGTGNTWCSFGGNWTASKL